MIKLDFNQIRAMIRYIFRQTKIEIVICLNEEINENKKLKLLKLYHDSKFGGHLGINKTLKKLNKKYV